VPDTSDKARAITELLTQAGKLVEEALREHVAEEAAEDNEDTEKFDKKTKTKQQVRYLLSDGSPLTADQKDKLKAELHSGEVTVSDKKEKAEQPGSLIFEKSEDGPTDDFELVVPLHKVEEEPDGSLIVEAWANVSDFIDSDGEYFSRAGLESFLKSWEPFGNFRGQHDPQWVVGTINEPRIGKLASEKPLGAWILQNPVTKTDALFVRNHVVEPKAIKFIKAGVLTGLSLGGSVPIGGKVPIEVEVDDNGVVLRELAA
jgi:hypothetical protein